MYKLHIRLIAAQTHILRGLEILRHSPENRIRKGTRDGGTLHIHIVDVHILILCTSVYVGV
jgi:hypothetical protein